MLCVQGTSIIDLATLSTEEREARLQRRRDQLTTESAEEREARLHQMSMHQHERLATESSEEREACGYTE